MKSLNIKFSKLQRGEDQNTHQSLALFDFSDSYCATFTKWVFHIEKFQFHDSSPELQQILV